MLSIRIKSSEFYNELTSEFITVKEQELKLEHSLVSISKWESKWNKPFLSDDKKTNEEILDYIRCMVVDDDIDLNVLKCVDNEILQQISTYIQAPMTATWFSEDKHAAKGREVVTSELIYYWMITLGIPMECQYWHLNRLLTLVRVCNAKNAPQKKMSQRELLSRNRSLNAARRQANHTRG